MHRTILKDIASSGLLAWDAAPFLQKVTDVAPSIIYVFNQKTQSNEYSNRSLGAALGYSADEILEMGANMMPLLCHPADLPRVGAHFETIKTLNDGEVAQIEYRMKHQDGFWSWLLSYDTIFDRDATGSVLRHIGVASDISAQKAAEERAVAERQKAETTNEELRAFSYSMSHDMRSPSNTLNLLLTEFLETHGETLDPDALKLVGMALDTVDRMSLLVDDVLSYTRMVNHNLFVETVDMNTLVHNVVQDLQALIQTKAAIVDISDLPNVKADRMQIQVLLQNLVENAIKFHAPNMQPHVSISATVQDGGQSYAIVVADNGIGIKTDKHEQVFTMFKRLNAQADYSGTGLGLAICRRIAANHASKIVLVSSPGSGATFSIELAAA